MFLNKNIGTKNTVYGTDVSKMLYTNIFFIVIKLVFGFHVTMYVMF